MVIAVNTRLLQQGKLEGTGWFLYETLQRITRHHPEHRFIFIFDRPYDPEFIFSDNITPVVVPPPTRHPLLWHVWFQWQVPRVIRKYRADLFLSPDGYLSLNTPVKQLAVIHDLNFVHRPQDLPWLTAWYYDYFFPKFARRATRIATVSSYSKEDLVRSYHINPSKIDVVYNGVNTLYTPTAKEEQLATRKTHTEGKPYFLYIGSLHPRKNIPGMLRAFDAFRKRTDKDFKLVIAGGEMFKTSSIRKTHKAMHDPDEVVFTGRLTTEELHQVLGAAFSLIFVPYFEGFGLPVVEAMRAGVPVICSNTSSLPEVGGEAAWYVNPFDEKEIAEGMERLADDPELRYRLIEKGTIRQQQFSWDQTAERLWESIRTCVSES